MEILLLIILFGAGVAYFASQNTAIVTMQLWHYTFQNVPLYVIVLASVFVGLFMAWIIHLASTASWKISMFHKNRAIKETQGTVDALKRRVDELEEENQRLKQNRPALSFKDRFRPA